ncbi:helix-turn-helix transcriptional regulator [Streptomyces sp. NPDC047726]|uniref:helix-turn-helix domain-containing protein n=1 Tax=unclassified Streptomyces TaxID=2593676 RepID=UPI0033DEE74B
MDNRQEVKAFLSSRRARITPEDAGLTHYGRTRRVPGLRRSEVAELAGVSVEYYSKLERGDLAGVSESVLHALGRALQLDEAEQSHLADLARAAGPPSRSRRRPTAQKIRPSVARLLDGMSGLPAYVNNGRLDVLASNPLADALFSPVFGGAARPVNHARFHFLDPRARDFWVDWEQVADNSVAMLRIEAGRDPYDRALTDLVGELSTRSEAFRVRWASHDVHLHLTGHKRFRHPVVGTLDLSYEVLDLAADPGLSLVAFNAEAGSPDDDALRCLASWAATLDPADAQATPDQR